jgi:hypothetical protein
MPAANLRLEQFILPPLENRASVDADRLGNDRVAFSESQKLQSRALSADCLAGYIAWPGRALGL